MNIKSSFAFSQGTEYKTESRTKFVLANCAYIKNLREGVVQKEYHAHSLYEFHLVLNGTFQMQLIDGSSLTVQKNSFVIIPGGVRHRIILESDGFEKLLLAFQMENNEESGNYYSCFAKKLQMVKSYEMNESMKVLTDMIRQLMCDRNQEYETLTALYFYSCIAEAAQVVVGRRKIPSDSKYYDERVDRAVKFIQKNRSKRIKAQEVADYAAMSKRQLLRYFVKYFGCSIDEYIRREKIEQARILLHDTELSIAEIADVLGFTEVSAFTNYYKRYEGITPSKFRKTKYIT